MQLSGRGVGLSLIASVLFVLIPGYVRELAPLDGVQVFAQRVLWSIPMVLLLVLLTRQWGVLGAVAQRLRREPRLLAALPLRGGAVLPRPFLPPAPGMPGIPGMPPPRRSCRIIFCASPNRSIS